MIDRDSQIAFLLGRGYNHEQIATAVGISRRRVDQLLHEDGRILEEARRVQEQSEPLAVAKLRELMLTSKDERVQLQAAIGLLKQPTEVDAPKQTITTLHIHRTADGEETVSVEES